MRHRICWCAASVAIVLCTVSLAAAQAPSSPISGAIRHAGVVTSQSPAKNMGAWPSMAASPTVTMRPCNGRSALLATGRASVAPRGGRTTGLYFPTFYPIYPLPTNYGYRPTYYPTYPNYQPVEEEDAKRVILRVSTYDDKKRAKERIGRGDASFSRRQYVSAVARYQEAAGIAPDLGEAHLRLAVALIAQRKYPAATAAFLEALEVRTDWTDSKLHLDQLYAPGELAKTTSMLTRLAESDPMNPQAALALGVQLYFSGQHEKAEMYFNRAAQLGVDEDDRLSAFLPVNVARGG